MILPFRSAHVKRSTGVVPVCSGITAALVCVDRGPGSCCAQTFCRAGFSCREGITSYGDVVYRFSYCVANRFAASVFWG